MPTNTSGTNIYATIISVILFCATIIGSSIGVTNSIDKRFHSLEIQINEVFKNWISI